MVLNMNICRSGATRRVLSWENHWPIFLVLTFLTWKSWPFQTFPAGIPGCQPSYNAQKATPHAVAKWSFWFARITSWNILNGRSERFQLIFVRWWSWTYIFVLFCNDKCIFSTKTSETFEDHPQIFSQKGPDSWMLFLTPAARPFQVTVLWVLLNIYLCTLLQGQVHLQFYTHSMAFFFLLLIIFGMSELERQEKNDQCSRWYYCPSSNRYG